MEFNPTKQEAGAETRTTNYEGGEAFEPASPELRLYKLTINNLLEDTFYREDDEALTELRQAFDAAADEDPEFVLKLAAFAQQEAGLRSVSTMLWVLAANDERTQPFVREYATGVLVRPDQVVNAVAMHDTVFDRSLPQSMRKGINDALHTWDAYQFAKYDTDRREYNLRDVLNRTHPKPRDDEHREIFRRLMRGRMDADEHADVEPLETPETWETVISEQGNNAEAWRSVVDRMGLLAKVRNVRNMLKAGLDGDEIFGDVDPEAAREAMFFPFRFYQSYQAMRTAGVRDDYVERWLSDAIDMTTANVPDRLGDTFVAVDVSGSMETPLSERSTMDYVDIATFFGAVLSQKGADVGAFGSDFERVRFHSGTPTVERQRTIRQNGRALGGSTNAWKALEHLTQSDVQYDRVVFLTDMQAWDSTRFVGGRGTFPGDGRQTVKDWFDTYSQDVNPEVALYMIDLSSYGDLVTPEGYPRVFNVNGWTSRIVDFMVHAEEPGDAIQQVREYEPE